MRSVDGERPAGLGLRVIAAAAGAGLVVFGAWAFVSPSSFYRTLATFPPLNVHFLHDIGAFQIGLGAVLLFAVASSDALLAALAGVAVGSGVHLLSHLLDVGRGGNPVRDLALLSLLTLVLAGAALLRWRELHR